MLLFSSNAFRLGAMVFLAISLSNIICVLLCKFWKVTILEFSIFLNPWFSLVKKEINGTLFKLGWLPIGAYIKPLGMLKEDLQSIPAEELPFSFLSKSRTKQVLFRLVPSLVWLFFLLLSLYTLEGSGNMLKAIEEMFNYTLLGIKTMFGSSSNSEFVKVTTNILIDKNIIAFALILLISIYLVLTLLAKIMSLLSQGEKKISWLVKLPAFVVTIFGAYLTFWKIPAFVFSFFSFRQNISYVVSFLSGLYCIGLLIFILVMILVKLPRQQRLTTQM